MDFLVTDIETIDRQGVPPRVLGDDRCPAAPHHQIVAISVCYVGIHERRRTEPVKIGGPILIQGECETDLVRRWFTSWHDHWSDDWKPQIAGWNIRAFDLPVIQAACMRHGLVMPILWDKAVTNRFQGYLVHDLQDQLTLTGAAKSPSMDAYAKLIGWPGKIMDAGTTTDLWNSGPDGQEQVRELVMTDVCQETAVLLREALCRGWIDAAQHDQAVADLLIRVNTDRRLAKLRHVNRSTVLLGEEASIAAIDAR